ncbi:hypothetical protein AAG570_009719 [Ranatra chinensis]|uniref:PDZ domain-containing protein n=1 Tax=Ranatra chinensis TaxID=642074 RepID=A0ABD0YPV8_9HEMI
MPKERSRGPRSLFLKRSENGFGFTLRHFIVYPPESYTVAGGMECGGPMDTIFVKSVRGGSAAALGGLATGDRLLSVNGQPTAGRPYAHVIRLIQQSPNYLHLLVVPKEEDVLQLYFGETAHNPETNQRPPRIRSPDYFGDHSPGAYPPRRSSDTSSRGVAMSGKNGSSSVSEYSSGGSGGGGSYSLPSSATTPGCRLSLDAGGLSPSSLSSVHTTGSSAPLQHTTADDSIIISRIRKSCEQKEEFLKRPPGPMWSANNGQSDASTTGVIQREFYARPQRLQPPVWPPAIPASQAAIPISANSGQQLSPKERGFIYGGAVTNPPGSGRFTTRLGRIQEGAGSGSNSILRTSSPPPSHRIVSERTRQFEQGQCQMDRTMLYRSELARLGAKRYVPNVEVRRRQFENRAANWKAQRESRSLDSTERGYTERPRSNSVEGVIVSDDTWPQRHKAVRQDSYLAAVKKPVTSSVERNGSRSRSASSSGSRPSSLVQPLPTITLDPPPPSSTHPVAIAGQRQQAAGQKRPTTLDLASSNRRQTIAPALSVSDSPAVTPEGDSSPQSSPGLDSVVRRHKSISDDNG